MFRNFDQEKEDIEHGRWILGLPAILEREDLENHSKQLIAEVYSRVASRNSRATRVLDKHPNYSNHMDLIRELCPNAKFVHLIRDGRQVALSMMSVNERVGHSAGSILPAALDWIRFISNARESGAKMGNDYMEVYYEDLLENGQARLADIFKFCGLHHDAELCQNIIDQLNPEKGKMSAGRPDSNVRKSDWSDKMDLRERFVFDKVAGRLLCELGYAEPNWWAIGPFDKAKVTVGSPFVKIKRAIKAGIEQLRQPVVKT